MMNSLSPLSSGLLEAVVGQPVIDAGGWIFAPSGSVSAEPIVVALLAVGFVGMSIKSVFDSILSDEEERATSEGSDDGLMPEEGGDDLGGLGGLDDGDEEFGEFEDGDFGDMDSGADTDELEHRLDELETEVGSLSSTVNTVRNENEQISETVDDVEENVRKLLDIYEMVTRGVNPFADDIDAGGLGGPGENSLGLFADEGEQTEEELEGDIANADAEGFFDEELVDDDEELEANTDVGEVLGTEGDDGGENAFEADFEDEFDESEDFEMDDDFADSGSAEGGDSEGGKSFAELKDEYESGDAEWAEGEEPDGEDSLTSEERDQALEQGDGEEETADGLSEFDEESVDDALADDDLFDTVIEEESADGETTDEPPVEEAESSVETETAEETEPTTEPAVEADGVEDAATDGTAAGETETPDATESPPAQSATTDASRDDGKPYLTDLPDGFLADLIVVEWLEFLVEEVGVRATAEAIHYYERIEWIDEDVADQLQAYLQGFDAGGDPETLTIDHHTKSLRYVSQLNGGGAESVALEAMPAMAGGGTDGIQR